MRRRDARYRPSWNAPAETLEVWIVPTADIWTGVGESGNFSDPHNWQGLTIPQTGDNLEFPADVANYAPNDDMGLGYGTITIDSAGYTIGSLDGLATSGIATTYGGGTSTIAGALTLAGGASTTATVASGGMLELSGGLGGESGLTVTGGGAVPGGTLVFSGPSANAYTGPTTVAAGKLQLGKPDGVAALAGPLVVGDLGGDSAVVQDLASNQIGSLVPVTVHVGATILLDGHDDAVGPLLLLGGAVTTGNGDGTFGHLTLDGPMAADASAGIHGDMTLGSDTTVTVASGSTLTLDGPIGGAYGLTLGYSQTFPDTSVHPGGGTLRFQGTMDGNTANTYTGATSIQLGTLALAKADGTVAVPGALNISDPVANEATVRDEADGQLGASTVVTLYGGGTLDLNGWFDTVDGLDLLGESDGTVVQTGSGALAINGGVDDMSQAALTIEGNLTLGANTTFTVASGATLNLDAAIGDDGHNYSLTLAGDQNLPIGGARATAGRW